MALMAWPAVRQMRVRNVPGELAYAMRLVALREDKSFNQMAIDLWWDAIRLHPSDDPQFGQAEDSKSGKPLTEPSL